MGSEQDLRNVRKVVDIAVLRKDFLCDVYQVYEAAAWGADVILLIIAGLEWSQLKKLYKAAIQIGLEVLVEAHTGDEVKMALELDNVIIGVNSRNLKTLRTDLSNIKRLAPLIPADRLSIAESGIKTRSEIDELRGLGYKGFLVGEVLMKCADPMAKLLEFTVENRRSYF
jgi:indole-3-glycerol phosphate synthase